MVLKVTHFETTSITITHIVHGLFSLPSHTSVSLAYPIGNTCVKAIRDTASEATECKYSFFMQHL